MSTVEIPDAMDAQGQPQRMQDCEEWYGIRFDGFFHIGQDYEHRVAGTVYCTRCHGTVFNVGIGNYFTGIRCVTCGWELCVHEG